MINTNYGLPPFVQVTDSGGNPMAGISVTFEAPTNGPSATFTADGLIGSGTNTAITTTGPDGVAFHDVTYFGANGITGAFVVTATVAGPPPVNWTFTNTDGIPY